MHKLIVALTVVTAVGLAGCTTGEKIATGAGVGAAIGAATTHSLGGVLIGAAIGGVATAIVELVLSELPEAPAAHTELAQVAERLGVSASYIAAVEAGRRNLTLGQLANIANAMRLGINVSFIRPNGEPVLAKRSPKVARPTSDSATG